VQSQNGRLAWNRDQPPTLTYRAAPGFVQIYDGRYVGREGTYVFRDTLADIYLSCTEQPITTCRSRPTPPGVPDDVIEHIFREFRRRGLMFLDGALALPATPGC
jgi:hypothetical protein